MLLTDTTFCLADLTDALSARFSENLEATLEEARTWAHDNNITTIDEVQAAAEAWYYAIMHEIGV
jgi:hypothetical protein